MKTYKRHFKSHINPTNGKIVHEDKRASKIDAIFEHEIELLGNQYEHHYIECELRFLPTCGYYFEMSINDEDTDFSDKTTEDINGRSKADIIIGLKNSYSYLVEALECHKKEADNEIYSLSKYGHEADFSNY
jgi:hypothetical protein